MLKAHFFSKKFASFFIGSTFLNKKLMFLNSNDRYKQEEGVGDSRVTSKFNQWAIYENGLPKDIQEKREESEAVKNIKLIFKYISLPINHLLSIMTLHSQSRILRCEVPINKKPYLGCSIRGSDQGMQIILIKSESPAEKALLKVKDIILEINGTPINSINDYNAAVGPLADKKALKIMRTEEGKDTILEVEVEFIYLE